MFVVAIDALADGPLEERAERGADAADRASA
jgi:hypothetical protein